MSIVLRLHITIMATSIVTNSNFSVWVSQDMSAMSSEGGVIGPAQGKTTEKKSINISKQLKLRTCTGHDPSTSAIRGLNPPKPSHQPPTTGQVLAHHIVENCNAEPHTPRPEWSAFNNKATKMKTGSWLIHKAPVCA